jgi:hypothetical protein
VYDTGTRPVLQLLAVSTHSTISCYSCHYYSAVRTVLTIIAMLWLHVYVCAQDTRLYSHKNGQSGGQAVMAPLQTVARLLKRENYHRELLSDPDVSRAIKTIVPWRPIDVVVTATTAVDSTPAYSNSKCDTKSDSSSGSSSSSASTATSTQDRTDSAMQCSTNNSSSSSMMKSQLELQQEAQAKEDARARVIAKHALQSTGSSTATNASTMQGKLCYSTSTNSCSHCAMQPLQCYMAVARMSNYVHFCCLCCVSYQCHRAYAWHC